MRYGLEDLTPEQCKVILSVAAAVVVFFIMMRERRTPRRGLAVCEHVEPGPPPGYEVKESEEHLGGSNRRGTMRKWRVYAGGRMIKEFNGALGETRDDALAWARERVGR